MQSFHQRQDAGRQGFMLFYFGLFTNFMSLGIISYENCSHDSLFSILHLVTMNAKQLCRAFIIQFLYKRNHNQVPHKEAMSVSFIDVEP